MGGKCDNKEGDLNRGRLFPRVLKYERSDNKKGDITEVKVHINNAYEFE